MLLLVYLDVGNYRRVVWLTLFGEWSPWFDLSFTSLAFNNFKDDFFDDFWRFFRRFFWDIKKKSFLDILFDLFRALLAFYLRGQLELEFDRNLSEGEGLGLTFLSHRWPSKPVPSHWQSIYREDWYLEYKWHFLIACIQTSKL